MALKLTDAQLAFLRDDKRVAELAAWVLSANNAYANMLRETLHGTTPVTNRVVIRYLVSSRADTGIVARLINAYHQVPHS